MFSQKSPVQTERFVAATCRCNVLLQLVTQCVPTLRILESNLVSRVSCLSGNKAG